MAVTVSPTVPLPLPPERRLQTAGPQQIELAISRAIRQLTGELYEAKITGINFEPCLNAFFTDAVEIRLTIAKPIDIPQIT